MLSAYIILFAFIVFPFISLVYVYKIRGDVRFFGLVEYLRKGWPVFAPLNVLLYLMSEKRARSAFQQMDNFPELKKLEENWDVIREEAQALYDNGYFNTTTDANNMSYYDVGFRTFYKYGWSKFYCTWYGQTLNSAKEHCPKTVELLKSIPSVNGSMFTILPPGSRLTRHLDPCACSLRYHLGLITPENPDCFIEVDGKRHVWHDGEAMLFDETYLHFAENQTDKPRIILMCDIDRPVNIFGRIINFCYKKLISQMIVPNLAGDQSGFFNRLFYKVTPILEKGKAMKKTNRSKYLAIKWTLNLILLSIFVGILSLITMGLISLFSQLF